MASPDSMTESQQNSIAIPGYLSSRADGLFINLQNSYSADGFKNFVDNLFAADSRFVELDYGAFLKLLYDADWLAAAPHKAKEIRIAKAIIHFPLQRQELYRTVKVLERGMQAEYVFESVNVEITLDEPVYGAPDVNGVAPIIRHVSTKVLQAASLNIDEFIAAMWVKGIKYGIQAEAVLKVLVERTLGRKIVALCLPPVEGKDADIQEICPDLHRDNSPKTLLNGKADMRAFQNRFPHIAKGEHLLKKVPRVLGKHGYKVTGEIIEPAVPKDLNLLALASTGTTAILEKDGDYLVAQMDGFLNIDPLTKIISITEKIETTAGVSMKTTGDLALNVEEFVEHGEVQEGRVVKGKHMTFKSNVFGYLVSSGGNIIVEGNLTGGRAESLGGNVTLGRASRAVVRAQEGEINAKYCENCTVIGKTIHIQHAVNCELIAEEIYADRVEGCMIAAECINILTSTESKNRESFITMIIPDLSLFEQAIASLQEKISGCKNSVATRMSEIEAMKTDQDFAKFLGLSESIKSGTIKLTSEQAGNWQKLVTKNASASNQVGDLNRQIFALERLINESEEEVATLTRNRDATGAGIGCVVDEILGQTTGQTMRSVHGVKIFIDMPANDIKALLQKVDSNKVRIFSEDKGSINWSFR